MKYKTHTVAGQTVIAPYVMSAMIDGWCVGRDCRTCPVNPPSGISCPTAFTEEEILKRMGNNIEIIHDGESEATKAAPRPNLAALKLYSDAQRMLGFIDGITQGPQMQNNAVSDAVEALSEILDKWRDLP